MAKKKTKVAKTATEALKMLWQEGFFRRWQTQPKASAYLARREHNFASSELGMALKRARHLTRRGKRGNYEYIQRHPFTAEETASVAKRRA